MFSGEFRHNLDAKNRLFIPAKFREELGEDFVIARSLRQNCLQVYSRAEWQEHIKPFESMDRKDSEKILRFLHRDAPPFTADAQGRIVLPVPLVQYAGITKGAVIVGCGKYAEIWSEEGYEAEMAAEDMDALRALAESFGL